MDILDNGLTADVMDDALWVFFNEPLEPLPFSASTTGGIALLVDFDIRDESEGSYFVDQHPSLVPEPGTLALFGLGLAGLGFARRKKAA